MCVARIAPVDGIGGGTGVRSGLRKTWHGRVRRATGHRSVVGDPVRRLTRRPRVVRPASAPVRAVRIRPARPARLERGELAGPVPGVPGRKRGRVSLRGPAVDGLGGRRPDVELVEPGLQRGADLLHGGASGDQPPRGPIDVDHGKDGRRDAVGGVEGVGRQLTDRLPSCMPWERSVTSSQGGHCVAATRRSSSAIPSSAVSSRNGRVSLSLDMVSRWPHPVGLDPRSGYLRGASGGSRSGRRCRSTGAAHPRT
jgi:hypothetical protein